MSPTRFVAKKEAGAFRTIVDGSAKISSTRGLGPNAFIGYKEYCDCPLDEIGDVMRAAVRFRRDLPAGARMVGCPTDFSRWFYSMRLAARDGLHVWTRTGARAALYCCLSMGSSSSAAWACTVSTAFNRRI